MAKATKKQALGRGLSALLKDPANDIQSAEDKNADKVVGNIIDLDISNIEVNPFQPRTSFNEDALRELASSIKELGVIQPITVRKLSFDKYQLVSGERRFRASKLLGNTTIPAYIRIANDQESLEMALVENIQRQDLDPIEIALSYQRLIDEIQLTQEQMSNRVGKNRSTIANYLRLLKLDPIVQTGMPNDQLNIYERIIADKLSVRQTEAFVKNYHKTASTETPKQTETPEFIKEGTKDLASYFGAKIDVKVSKNGRGKITIPFSSEEDFNRIQKLINSAK